MTATRNELGAFLRAHRDRITPAQAGLTAFPGPRRVPGLRREELALLAGLSPDYYRRLEQGRQDVVSDSILDGLARALRLDAVESAHLHDLAEPRRRRSSTAAAQQADPGLLRVMTALDHLPVLLLGRRSEVLAGNALVASVLGHRFEPGDSFMQWLLQDAGARERIVNWQTFAEQAVAAARRETARHPDDAVLRRHIDLLRKDPEIDRWWADHHVRDYASATKRIAHPQGGPMQFDVEIVTGPFDPDQHLVVYTVQPDSRTAEILPMLRSWDVASAASG